MEGTTISEPTYTVTLKLTSSELAIFRAMLQNPINGETNLERDFRTTLWNIISPVTASVA